MNQLDDSDLPTTPRAKVRIAQGPHENTFAHIQAALLSATRAAQNLSDEALVPLLMEPEFLVECSPLERELIYRLATRLEVEAEERREFDLVPKARHQPKYTT